MWHSHLLINVGDNPDRPDWRNCRRWLRNLYRVHQRLAMGFPSCVPAATEREAAYCRPFAEEAYPQRRDLPAESNDCAERERREDTGFLFRIDYPVDFKQGGRRPVIILQSGKEPDWYNAFGLIEGAADDQGRPIGNAGFLLATPPRKQPVSIDLERDTLVLSSEKENHRLREGDLVRFRLRANPTRKVQDGSPNGKRKRVNPAPEDHERWLAGKLATAVDAKIRIENFITGWAYGWRSKYEPQPRQKMQWWSVLFEGTFRLKDPAALKRLLESGIGPAKAFGFGLLSIAPAR